MSRNTYLHINSSIDRTTSDLSTSSWTTWLSTPILVSSNSKVRISLEACEIPNVLYNFGDFENVFWWIDNPSGTNVLYGEVISTSRNYADGAAFASYMNVLLSGKSIVFTYDTNTSRLSITNNRANPIRIVESYRYSILNNTYNSAIDKLGFTQQISTTNILASASLTAQTVFKLMRTNCYYLTCDSVSSSTKETIAPNPYRQGHQIIAHITAQNFGSLSQLQYLPATDIQIQSQSLERLKFALLDDNLYPITNIYVPITLTVKISVY